MGGIKRNDFFDMAAQNKLMDAMANGLSFSNSNKVSICSVNDVICHAIMLLPEAQFLAKSPPSLLLALASSCGSDKVKNLHTL